MKTYRVWVRVNAHQTVVVIVLAENDWSCKLIAEATYGVGNVLNYTQIDSVPQ